MDQEQEKKKFWRVRKKPVYIAVALILFITVPIFVWLFSEMHAAGKALDAFGQLLIAKDYDRAYSVASQDFQTAISKQEFVQQQTTLCVKLGPLKGLKRGATETNFDSNGGFTTIETSLIFEKAERPFAFKLKKVGSSWRVYGYKEE